MGTRIFDHLGNSVYASALPEGRLLLTEDLFLLGCQNERAYDINILKLEDLLKMQDESVSFRKLAVVLKNPRINGININFGIWGVGDIGHMAATSKYTLVQFTDRDFTSNRDGFERLNLFCNKSGRALASLRTDSPILAEHAVNMCDIICTILYGP